MKKSYTIYTQLENNEDETLRLGPIAFGFQTEEAALEWLRKCEKGNTYFIILTYSS